MTKVCRIKIKIVEKVGESAMVKITWTRNVSEIALVAALTGLKDAAAEWYANKHDIKPGH